MDPAEEKLFEAVALEVAEKRMKPGLYAKAFSEAMGDKDKALAIYIKLRVEDMRQEIEAAAQAAAVALDTTDPRCRCGHRRSVHPFKSGWLGPYYPCSTCGGCDNFKFQ